jgi:competence protein ComEA
VLRAAFAEPRTFGAEQDTLPLRLDAVLPADEALDPAEDLARRARRAAPTLFRSGPARAPSPHTSGPSAAGRPTLDRAAPRRAGSDPWAGERPDLVPEPAHREGVFAPGALPAREDAVSVHAGTAFGRLLGPIRPEHTSDQAPYQAAHGWGRVAPDTVEPGTVEPDAGEPDTGEPDTGEPGWEDDFDHDPGHRAQPGSAHVPGGRPSLVARVAARWVPTGWRGARLDPGRVGAVALVLVAAVAAVVAAVGVWSGRPRPEPMPALPAVSLAEPTTSGAPAEPSAPAELVVSVSGKVARPGLLRLPDGARVADALEAAGGALPGTDLSTLNLARRLADGEQVAVGVTPAPEEAAAPTGGAPGTAGSTAAGGKVDLNRATLEQLDALPGVGPVTAQRILDWRSTHGRFARVDQLREVDGIGERRFAQLKDLVTA